MAGKSLGRTTDNAKVVRGFAEGGFVSRGTTRDARVVGAPTGTSAASTLANAQSVLRAKITAASDVLAARRQRLMSRFNEKSKERAVLRANNAKDAAGQSVKPKDKDKDKD